MKKYIYIFLIFIGLSGSAFADVFQGYFICDDIRISDGSKGVITLKIDGEELTFKYRGFPDLSIKYNLIHRGISEPFLAFVKSPNTGEDILTLRHEKNYEFHYNRINTDGGWKAKGRLIYGSCEKID